MKKKVKKSLNVLDKALLGATGGVIEDDVLVFGFDPNPGDEASIIGVIDIEPG